MTASSRPTSTRRRRGSGRSQPGGPEPDLVELARPSNLAAAWSLETGTVFLNHGSFGACPRPVLDAQQAWRERLEAQPVRFLARELEAALDGARASLAAFLGADPDDLAFVPNATHAMNTVLRSLHFAPGDELLATDHEYNAAANALRAAAECDGATMVVAEVPFPIAGEDEVVDAVLRAVTTRTRLALLSHITSPTALVFPIERVAQELRDRGVVVLVDGAHAPGMLPLDLGRLADAGVGYYAGNGHKWICGPKGSGFLWVRSDLQGPIRPLAISHGANSARRDRSRYRLEFDWTGTSDPSAYLALPEAIRFMGGLIRGGWHALMAANRELARGGRAAILDQLGVPAPAPETMLGSMAAIALPIRPRDRTRSAATSPLDDDPLQAALRDGWGIEVPIGPWPPTWHPGSRPAGRLLRISAQAYNAPGQYRLLAAALAELLGTVSP